MQNTFWTLINNDYYRIEDKQLKIAPADPKDNSIILEDAAPVQNLEPSTLELINKEFNTTIKIV